MLQSIPVRILIIPFAVGVGIFHGYMKPDLDRAQIDQLEDYMEQMDRWQGRYPEDFEVELLSGGSIRLAEEIGRRVVVLNFFATWCGPCREEMPELERFARQAGRDDVLLLGIDVDEPRSTVEEFIAGIEVSFPIGLDTDGRVASDYGVTSYPTTVVIGLDGRISLYQVGAISNADVTLTPAIAQQDDIRAGGLVVSKDEYLALLEAQPEIPSDNHEARLTGRALEIAKAMPCSCGCSQTVHECACQTADKITERLAEGNLDGKTDREVMEELNREFCVGVSG